MAKLFFRHGAMNSGKSTALLQVAYNYEERGMNILLLKPDIDKKGNDTIVSRLGLERTADIIADEKMDIRKTVVKLHKANKRISCLLVDEAQFLTETQVDQLFDLTVHENIPVICFGIRTDFLRALFPGSRRLFAVAHTIEELKTICRCGRKAMFNGRKLDGKFIFEGSQVAIDGDKNVTYESLCGKCYADELE